jgi:Spy/CpxP family protein refolding chaperone
MSKKAIIVILIISVAINLATVITFVYFWTSRSRVEAPIGPRPPERFPEWHGGPLEKKLKLNKQQLERIRQVNEEIRVKAQPIHEELFKKRHELMSLIQDKDPDKEKIDALIQDIAMLQAAHDKEICIGLLKIKEVLKPEQRKKLGMLMQALINPQGHQPHNNRMPPLPKPPEPYQGR